MGPKSLHCQFKLSNVNNKLINILSGQVIFVLSQPFSEIHFMKWNSYIFSCIGCLNLSFDTSMWQQSSISNLAWLIQTYFVLLFPDLSSLSYQLFKQNLLTSFLFNSFVCYLNDENKVYFLSYIVCLNHSPSYLSCQTQSYYNIWLLTFNLTSNLHQYHIPLILLPELKELFTPSYLSLAYNKLISLSGGQIIQLACWFKKIWYLIVLHII